MSMKRIFVAIDLSDEAREAVAAYMRTLRGHIRAKWEKIEKLHITVKFAGSVDESELAELVRVAAMTAEKTAPFKIRIEDTGAFLKRRGSSVLWLGLAAVYPPNKEDPFKNLAVQIDDAAVGREKRQFKPHLTIARLKAPKQSRQLVSKHLNAQFEPLEFLASELVVYESHLRPSGSQYEVVSTHRFNKPHHF